MKSHTATPAHQRKVLLEQDLENRILYGLSLEWDNALGNLSQSQSMGMKKPLFALNDGECNLAHWDVSKREMSFSRSFVKNHPWDAVREVLVHEMAHQYTHEVLGCHQETAHGPTFFKACRILRANPEASGSYQPLTDRLHDPELSEDDRMLAKIRKLLALGESQNPHEAEAALLKAQALIDRFNVDIHKQGKPPGYVSMFVGKPALRRFKEDYLLARLLVDHYFVFGIWVSTYVLDKGKMGRVFEITGRPENVKTAAYVHDFIVNQTHMAWNAYNTDNTYNRYRKSDFAFGLIEGFSKGLDKGRETQDTDPSTRLPMTLEHEALMAHADEKYPRIRRFTRKAGSVDETVRRKGKSVGEQLVLARALEKEARQKPKALPHHPS